MKIVQSLVVLTGIFLVIGLTGCPATTTPAPQNTGPVRAWSVWNEMENGQQREFSREVFNLEEVTCVAGDTAANFDFSGGSFSKGKIEYMLTGMTGTTSIAVVADSQEKSATEEPVEKYQSKYYPGYPYGFYWNNIWYSDGYWDCYSCGNVWYHGACPYHNVTYGYVYINTVTTVDNTNFWVIAATLLAAVNFPATAAPITDNGEFSITVPMGPTVETAVLNVETANGSFVITIRGEAYGGNVTNQYSLTATTQGSGTVTGAGTYDKGEVVDITATPATGWTFKNWIVNGTAGSTNPNAQVTMNGDVAVVAVFTQTQTIPPTTAPVVKFTRSGTTGTMQIFTDSLSLREITANASAAYLPAGATFADINSVGIEIVNLPSPYWYLRESSSGTMSANSWSTTITLDGVGVDNNGAAKTVALANWTGGRAIPFYTLSSVSGRIFSINTGLNCATLNGQTLATDTVGYIWP